MSLYKNTQPITSKTRTKRRRVSSATQTLLCLYFGPRVPLGLILQEYTPELKREEEERREKVKQAKKDEKERQEIEKEKRKKEISDFKKFSTEYKIKTMSFIDK